MPDVFISHCSKDRPFVERELVSLLEYFSITTWYCREEITGGQQWEDRIEEGLNACPWFLVALSPQAERSEWVKREVAWAVRNRKGRIRPVIIETCRPEQVHEDLYRTHHVDFRTATPEVGRSLLEAFGVTLPKPGYRRDPVNPADLTPLFPKQPLGELAVDKLLPEKDVERMEKVFHGLCLAFLTENPGALRRILDSPVWRNQPAVFRTRWERDPDLRAAIRLTRHELIPLIITGLAKTSDRQTLAPLVDDALRWYCHLCTRGEWQLANPLRDVLWRVLYDWGDLAKAERLLSGRCDNV